MALRRIDWLLFLLIYATALGVTVAYAVGSQVIVSDQMTEYKLYLKYVVEGSWSFEIDDIVNSCLMVTLVPARVQRITHVDQELLFKVFPCIFYSLMPAFIYLITRRYTKVSYAALAAFLVMSSFFFMYYPAIGRVGVALGFMAGAVWSILSRRYIFATTLGILVVFSHYATGIILLLLIVSVWLHLVGQYAMNRRKSVV